MKPLIWVLVAGVVGAAGMVEPAEAGDRAKSVRVASPRVVVRDVRVDHRDRRDDRRDARSDRRDRRDDWRDRRYFGTRDIVIIRDYYRPYYRPLPRGVRHHYVRHGHLPPGWARRIHPVPVHIVRHLPPVPHGYHRGIIDGHVVVHDSKGFILDVALLF